MFFGGASGEAGRILPLAIYPFGLAEMVARMEAKGEVEALVFNPSGAFPEWWGITNEPIPVRKYVRLSQELRPGLERLAAEYTAKYGFARSGFETFANARRELLPQIQKIGEDAEARTAEWEV